MTATPNSIITAPPWTAEALCAQTDPEIFFPEKGGSTRDAKAVCARCPVKAPCLEYALDHDERYGIFGGLSERERRRLARHVPIDTSLVTDVEFDTTADFTQETG